MLGLPEIIGAFVGICIAIALGVWIRAKKLTADSSDARPPIDQSDEPALKTNSLPGVWFDAVWRVMLAVFFGYAIGSLARLSSIPLWLAAIIVLLLFYGSVMIEGVVDRLMDRFFPSGIRRAAKPRDRDSVSFMQRLRLPMALLVGICLAWLGVLDALLKLIS